MLSHVKEEKVLQMSNVNQWWETLSSAHQVFWFIAVIFSVLFFIQFVLLITGFDSLGGDISSPDGSVGFEEEFSADVRPHGVVMVSVSFQ